MSKASTSTKDVMSLSTAQSDAVHTVFHDFFITPGNIDTSAFAQEINTAVAHLSDTLNQNFDTSTQATPALLKEKVDDLLSFDAQAKSTHALLKKYIEPLVMHSVLPNNPYCAAHLHCPVTTVSVIAELIIATLNQSMDSWDQSPIATHIETAFIHWFSEKIGFEKGEADGVFTSGGTQSNMTALMLARDHCMQQQTHLSVKLHGLDKNWQAYRVYCSEEAHFTIKRSCVVLGLGEQAVHVIKTNQKGEMCVHALKEALLLGKQQGHIPMAIVATAGTTDLGAVDPVDAIADIAKAYACWMHVDAAYGGALILSSQKQRLQGIEKAQSVTIDFHKMFFQPISCSALFVNNKTLLRTLRFHADYLNRDEDEEPNLVEKSLSTTRRFDALKIWLSIERLGTSSFSQMIDALFDLTKYCETAVDSHPRFTRYNDAQMTTVLFSVTGQDNDFHSSLRRKLLYNGDVIIAQTKKQEKIYFKLTLLNPCATKNNIDEILHHIDDHVQAILMEKMTRKKWLEKKI